MDNETDELLNSILTGSDGREALPLFDHVDDDLGYQTQFDQELLSPAGSTGSSHNPANNIDLVDIFANDLQPEDGGTLQGVNPHTNSPDPDPQKLHDDHDTDTSEDMTVVEPKQNKKPKGPKVQVQQPRARKVATRISSTNVYHHSGIKPTTNAAGTISIVRPNAINATPITLANGGTFDTGTTTILLPVLNSVSILAPLGPYSHSKKLFAIFLYQHVMCSFARARTYAIRWCSRGRVGGFWVWVCLEGCPWPINRCPTKTQVLTRANLHVTCWYRNITNNICYENKIQYSTDAYAKNCFTEEWIFTAHNHQNESHNIIGWIEEEKNVWIEFRFRW